ncbi:MAG: radical SAM protein [Ruminococcus sp.]|jgi:molybdenum cofactor biosynthesis enzyme MoaA|nr:radical SAM protein [Ruminococcus sp.]
MEIKKLVVKTGTQCTLKCEKCGEFNPFIKNHLKFSLTAEHLSKQVEKIQNALKIEVLHIAGGEAFMHKDLDRLIEAVSVMPNIGRIEVVSNGTCKVSDSLASALHKAREKVLVLISDYSGASVNQTEFIGALDKEAVKYKVMKDMKWLDKTDISYKGFSDDKLLEIAEKCSGFRDRHFSLINGIVTAHCPTSGSLLFFKEYCDKFPDMWFSVDDTAEEQLEESFVRLNEKGSTPMCNYCVSNAEAEETVAGKQIMSSKEWAEQFSVKTLVSAGKPIYIYGNYSKHIDKLKKWVGEHGGEIAGCFDPEKVSVDDLKELPAGVIIVCDVLRQVPFTIEEIAERSGDKHILFDVYDLLSYPHYIKCLAENSTVTNVTCRFCYASRRSCGIRRNAMGLMPGEKTKVISHIAMKNGHQCNLKCKYCCEFVPYLPPEKKQFKNEEAIKSLQKLSNNVEFISLLSLSGGEALFNPEIPRLLDVYTALPNIGDIYFLTNGTYVPKSETLDALEKHSDRVRIIINGYDINNDAESMVPQLDKRKIPYVIRPAEGWYQPGDPVFHNKSVDELKHLYRYCRINNRTDNYYLYVDGKISLRCGYVSAQLYAYDMWDKCPTDWIDILNIDEKDFPAALTTLEEKMYCDTCNYCIVPDGEDVYTPPAGDQLQYAGT